MIGAFFGSAGLGAVQSSSFLLARGEAGAIVGPIARGLGVFYNAIFNGVYNVNPGFALGIAIILFTLIIKGAFSPLSYMQIKSTKKMQEIQPKINAIQAKYKNQTDRESQMQMQMEIQKVQRESGVNLLAGCLPLLVQLPILYALYHIFQAPYLYVNAINANYSEIANVFLSIPVQARVDALYNIAVNHSLAIDLAVHGDLVKLVNAMSAEEWRAVLMSFSKYTTDLQGLYDHKVFVETFFGINLLYKTGLSFPGIIIPILSGITTYFTGKSATDTQPQDPNDPMAGAMQSMNFVMPAIMAVMAGTVPAGVGLYWVISNLFQFLIQKIAGVVYDKNKDRIDEKDRQAAIKRTQEQQKAKEALKAANKAKAEKRKK